MLRLASDADVNGNIVRGLRRRVPELDLVTVQEAGLREAPDLELLEWAASEERALITNDRRTMIGHAQGRIEAGLPMHGLLVLRKGTTIGRAIDAVELVAGGCDEGELRDQIWHLPFD